MRTAKVKDTAQLRNSKKETLLDPLLKLLQVIIINAGQEDFSDLLKKYEYKGRDYAEWLKEEVKAHKPVESKHKEFKPKLLGALREKDWEVTKFDSDKITIHSWNVNGFRAVNKKGNFEEFLKKENPTIVCLNETKVDKGTFAKENLGKYVPKNYLQYFNDAEKKGRGLVQKIGYSGTGILTKVKPLAVHADLGIQRHDKEGRTITAEYDKFVLVACYVPNAKQKLERLAERTKEWDVDFRAYLKYLETSLKKPVILCGDLNAIHHSIDIAAPRSNERSAGFTIQERVQFQHMLDLGFFDSFRYLYPEKVKYSYWNLRSDARKVNKGWRLDYFILSNSLKPVLVDQEILNEYYGSDHCPLKVELDFSKEEKKEEEKDDKE